MVIGIDLALLNARPTLTPTDAPSTPHSVSRPGFRVAGSELSRAS
jgi:hypothetical protein